MIKEAISKLVNGENLPYETAMQVMDEIMSGEASQVLTAAYLTAMSAKGETVDEITASAVGMRRHALKPPAQGDLFEIVGTGGDRSNSFNISTTSAFVIAAAGIPVAKHGNRAATSKSGAADVLEALGAKITLTPEQSAEVLKRCGFCFLFAQTYHGAMKYVAPVRRELGIRTVFNLLGPLTNPANANMQLLGVYSRELVRPMAEVLYKLGVKHAMSVYGEDGLDEISVSAPTYVCEIRNGDFSEYTITPEEFGIERCDKSELVGGTPERSAEITLSVLKGERSAARSAVLLNSAAAIHIADERKSIQDALKTAQEIIDGGRALKTLEEYIKATNEIR